MHRPPVKVQVGKRCPKCGSRWTRSHAYVPRDPNEGRSVRFFDGCWECGFRGTSIATQREQPPHA